ncbi:MAG: YqcC family protein [Cyclobacteriaceae bacterium]|nr:YqcC family protein [Cyclobacteriaceae bacterium]
MKPIATDYEKASALIDAIENELKRLNHWSEPLPKEAFDNMGAFGQNTMAFEQWIQFILLDRLRLIIKEQDSFPQESQLATYGVRVFDGDPDANQLNDLLYQLDELVNKINSKPESVDINPQPPTVTFGTSELPQVVYTLIDVLHEFEGDGLESQLQTYDTFLGICATSVRPELSNLLMKAASRTENETSRKRIEEAAQSILKGGRAAEPYNHEEAMRKYKEEHKKNYPS